MTIDLNDSTANITVNVPLTISQILALHPDSPAAPSALLTAERDGVGSFATCDIQQRLRAEREWTGAIAAMNALLQNVSHTPHAEKASPLGIVISGNAPVLTEPALSDRLSAWVFTPQPVNAHLWRSRQLPPGEQAIVSPPLTIWLGILPLLPDDPLAAEQFCLVLTGSFSLVMVLGQTPQGEPGFRFSFDPAVIEEVYQALRWRLLATAADHVPEVDALVEIFAPRLPDYRLVTQFSHLMLQHLPAPTIAKREHNHAVPQQNWSMAGVDPNWEQPRLPGGRGASHPDMELLQAIAHEVRTPLATIRTLTRLALKQKNLPKMVIKQLTAIDQECSEQIDRFGLIFQAVELETTPHKSSLMPLATTSLDDVFQQSIPRWQQQAERSSLTLEVMLPRQMPQVVSNPTLLDQVLSSLVERFTQQLPNGSHIRVMATLAGSQLKLQLESDAPRVRDGESEMPLKSALRSIGNLLMFQPETGNLSLNLAVTKNLFHALGGKLIVRQRPQHGEVLTMFLPLDMSSPDIYEV